MPTSVPVPFSEPPYLMGLPSAYYKESHLRWQKTCRAFAEETMMPYAAEWEKDGDVPRMIRTTRLDDSIPDLYRGSLRKICGCEFPHPEPLGSITYKMAQKIGYT
jgi:hypothetical protein